MQFSLNTIGGKLIASTAVLGAAAGIAGLGTFGTFTSTTSASNTTATTGTVSIVLGGTATSPASSNFNVAAAGMVPGDTVQRTVTLSNNGNQDLASVTMTTAASSSSNLDTDKTNGLQLSIQTCANAWKVNPATNVYSCDGNGGATQVFGTGPVIQSNAPLTSPLSLKAGQSDNLLVSLSLPANAGNEFQGKTSTVAFAFTGTQRAAKNS